MAFPCHLLNFWRSPILLWQPQQRGSSLEPHTPQSSSTQAHPNQLSWRSFSLISARSSARSSSGSSSRSSCPSVHRGSEVNFTLDCGELRVGQEKLGGSSQWMVNLNWNLPSNSLCSMRRLVLQNLMSIQPGSVAFLSVGFTPAAHKIGVMSPPILRRLPR
ncbi:unnamed protein product [Microthlaspi erraticum]|uniref:Uncharacterized protein n=1 Tax=Microthlaspi erraticum TaxID=1685480 RepID=A0A6D2HWM0_9BRAS|nr:unnamed protein product [Microthlaspi erraticum]